MIGRTQPHPALRALDVLVGKWSWNGRATNGSFEVTGWARYEWLEGKHFLIERAALTAAGSTNNNIAVVGYDEDAR